MLLTLLYFAGEAPVPGDASAAVQVALIGAVAPVVLVIINEIFKRWRNSKVNAEGEPREGVLAPVDEVPRAQFEQLLDRIAEMDERSHEREKAHEQDRDRWLAERRAAAEEADRHRRDMIVEVERRVRAETMLQAIQGGTSRG